jgi:hypothetical protein
MTTPQITTTVTHGFVRHEERDVHIAAENGEEIPVYNEDDRPELNSQPGGRVIPGVIGPPQPAFPHVLPLVILFDDDEDEDEDEDDDWGDDDDENYDDDDELDFDTHGDGGNGWLDEI